MWLRSSVASILSYMEPNWVLSEIDAEKNVLLVIDKKYALSFVLGCTYLHLALIIIPFYWRFQSSITKNIVLAFLIGGGIVLFNVLRIAVVTQIWCNDILPWMIIHSGTDFLIHTGTLVPAILAAIRSDMEPIETPLTAVKLQKTFNSIR